MSMGKNMIKCRTRKEKFLLFFSLLFIRSTVFFFLDFYCYSAVVFIAFSLLCFTFLALRKSTRGGKWAYENNSLYSERYDARGAVNANTTALGIEWVQRQTEERH